MQHLFLVLVIQISLFLNISQAAIVASHSTLPSNEKDGFPGPLLERNNATTLIIFGTREANRNPAKMLTDCPRQYGSEGVLELDVFGRRQAIGIGSAIRAFSGPLAEALTSEMHSSSATASEKTLEIIQQAIFPSATTIYSVSDELLQLSMVDNCAAALAAWTPIVDETIPSLRTLSSQHEDILQYMATNTGWNCSIAEAANLADNLNQIKLYNDPYPAWMTHCSLPGYTTDSIIAAYSNFSEMPQLACANDYSCVRVMAGVWAGHILGVLDSANDTDHPTLVGYSTGTETVLSLMKLFGIDQNQLESASGFLFEYRPEPEGLRMLTHEPLLIDGHVFKQARLIPELQADSDGFVSLDSIRSLVTPYAHADWRSACGLA